jgi:hypothetical protein
MVYLYRADDGTTVEHVQAITCEVPLPLMLIQGGVSYVRVWPTPYVIYQASGFTPYDRVSQDPLERWKREELSKY